MKGVDVASAPTPGVGARAEAAKDAQRILTIRVRDESWTLAIGNVSVAEKFAVRKATGLPLEAFLTDEDKFGEDSVVLLWWLARRANGEDGLSWPDALSEWPADLTDGDLVIDVAESPDEKADDPEA